MFAEHWGGGIGCRRGERLAGRSNVKETTECMGRRSGSQEQRVMLM